MRGAPRLSPGSGKDGGSPERKSLPVVRSRRRTGRRRPRAQPAGHLPRAAARGSAGALGPRARAGAAEPEAGPGRELQFPGAIARSTEASDPSSLPASGPLTLSSGLGGPRKACGVRMMRLLVSVLLALFAVSHAEDGARLLASKSLLNRYAVEGRDLTLQYSIYNVGSSAALDVELSDDSFPPEDFGIVSGMLNVKWDRIAPASNVSHTVVLRPLKAGYFNFTSATVTYLAQEDGPVVIGFTSAPGQGGILAQREFDRRFSPHFLDWAAFGVMTLPSIGIPLLLWYSSKRKYDTPKTKKN
ncbi:translocon-associated protein subunit beta [Phoca vitulina]|nr:translocon-associated protein subunit beta [Phoca vitulina]